MRRSLAVLGIVLATAGAAWVTWPRPSVRIDIAPGGVATVDGAALPETLVVRARGGGAVIRVVNRDTTRHALALFAADAGATVDYRIRTPGVYGGSCSTHPSGSLTYVVR